MEDEDGIESPSSTPVKTLSGFLDECCVYYMSIGVSYEEYWFGDYTRLAFYHKAYEARVQMRNTELWLQGRYIYDALICVSPILHAFAKKGTKPMPYHEKPFEKPKKLTKEEQRAAFMAKWQRDKAAWKEAQKQRATTNATEHTSTVANNGFNN